MKLEGFLMRNYMNISEFYVWEAIKDFIGGYLLANLLCRIQTNKQKNPVIPIKK